jgi:hypothetical protein
MENLEFEYKDKKVKLNYEGRIVEFPFEFEVSKETVCELVEYMEHLVVILKLLPEKSISQILYLAKGEPYAVLKATCSTCKHWSGRKIKGTVAGNCELYCHNMHRDENCGSWTPAN